MSWLGLTNYLCVSLEIIDVAFKRTFSLIMRCNEFQFLLVNKYFDVKFPTQKKKLMKKIDGCV
jgi:hypothetical protein